MAINISNSLAKYSLPKNKKLAVAVSGGSDSMALLVLAQSWANDNASEIIVLSVDHRLRQESSEETKSVKIIANDLGIECEILVWQHDDKKNNMHARAREARYDLMTTWCGENGVDTLLTAHHQDDEIENFIIKLYRGGGSLGFLSEELWYYNNIRIIRPLLNYSKKDLRQYILENKIEWFEDKSNDNPQYLRANVRKWLRGLPESMDYDMLKQRFLLSKSHINEAARFMQKYLIKALAEHCQISPFGYAKLDYDNNIDDILLYNVFSHLLVTVSGFGNIARADSVKGLIQELKIGSKKKWTLHGCAIEKKKNEIWFYRIYGKKPPAQSKLSQNLKWDNRWLIANIKSNKEVKSSRVVDYLSQNEYIELKKESKYSKYFKLPKEILLSLPVVKDQNRVVAIPNIDFYIDDTEKYEFIFEPSYISRLVHYY